MKGLREKFRNEKGFTLVEMLIVVAIIAILVAVSIPLVGSALEKANDATDQANERAAKAEAAIKYLGVEDGSFNEVTGTFYYDAVNGKLLTADEAKNTTTGIKAGYGKCKNADGCYGYVTGGTNDTHVGKIVSVEIATGGSIKISWTAIPS